MKQAFVVLIAGVIVGAAAMFAFLDGGQGSAGTQGPDVVRDLQRPPKMSGAVATKHREEGYANLHSIEQILALPTDFAQTEALYVLAGRSDSGAVQNLIHDANRISDPADRKDALTVLFSRLTELDPPSALAMARTGLISADRDIESVVWRSWAKYDLDAALAAAKSQGGAGQRNRAAQAMFAAYGYLGNDATDRIEDELGIRPDRTSRGRYLYDLADRSPAEAVDYVTGIPSSREQRQAASWLANHLVRTDPTGAAGYAALFSDPKLREVYENAVATALAAAEPEVVLERLWGSHQSDAERNQVYAAMRELASRDIEMAMQYFESATSSQDRQYFAAMIAEELARQDPARAIAWARDQERNPEEGLLADVLARIAQSDPELAMQEANAIRHAEQRSSAIWRIVSRMSRSDPSRAAEFVNQIDRRFERTYAATSVLMTWAQNDPDAAIQWLNSSSNLDVREVLEHAGNNLMRRQLETAMRLLPKLDEEHAAGWRYQIAQNLAAQRSAAEAQNFISRFQGTEDYDRLRAAVVGGLAKRDIPLARQLADQLPNSVDRDMAYGQLVAQHANVNPREAAGWLGSISDQTQRSMATNQLVRNWYAQDSEAVSAWAASLPDGAQRDDAIVALVSNWDEITPARRRLIDSIGDSGKQTQAQVAHIRAVARSDWRKAEAMLAETDMSHLDRQNVERLINRYRNR